MKYNFPEEPFARAFLENDGSSINERISLGMLEHAKYQEILFPENCMLPTVEKSPEIQPRILNLAWAFVTRHSFPNSCAFSIRNTPRH